MIRSAVRIVVLDSQTKLASALLPMSQLVMHHVKLLPSAKLIMDGNGSVWRNNVTTELVMEYSDNAM
jgi:hypothetical protein